MSITITGLLVAVIGKAFEWAGISVGSAEINTFIQVGLQIIGLITAYIGRFRQGDITWYGSKKPTIVSA